MIKIQDQFQHSENVRRTVVFVFVQLLLIRMHTPGPRPGWRMTALQADAARRGVERRGAAAVCWRRAPGVGD